MNGLVFGIDQGIASCGWAVLRHPTPSDPTGEIVAMGATAELEGAFASIAFRQLEMQDSEKLVGICQFEARAYACWLQAQSGQPLRLPSEAEWEAAARGVQRRRWPWGDTDPERWQMAADPAHLRRCSPVGVFVQADSPGGLTDLAGNVWEWTTSAYTDRLDAATLNAEAPDGLARRVLRGGSWNNPTVFCRASFRSRYPPDFRNFNIGFRLVVSCPIPGTEP